MPYTFITLPSPVGELKLVANGSRLAAILWENDKPDRVRLGPMSEAPDNPVLIRTARQLEEYFSGTRDCFDLELDFDGTDFQKKVWTALLTIPFGETRTYSQIAEQIGSPSAVRAQLGRFGFTGPTAEQRIGTMSGGEKARLALALSLLAG